MQSFKTAGLVWRRRTANKSMLYRTMVALSPEAGQFAPFT